MSRGSMTVASRTSLRKHFEGYTVEKLSKLAYKPKARINMKTIITSICLILTLECFSQTHTITKVWETDTVLATPESVLPDFKNQLLYVSLIDGEGWAGDGKGGIAILSTNGQIVNSNWITGLNAPKGLGRIGNLLYVADNDEVVVIDMKRNAVQSKIRINGAKRLNDITVDSQSKAVFVADSKTGRIWRIIDDRPELYLDSIKGANGLKFVKGNLFFANGKTLMKADAGKQLSRIAELPSGIDGIEPVGNGDFLVTAWSGCVYYVFPNGQFEILLDTRNEKKNAADLGFDPHKRIMYVPSFNGKTVAAYQLK